MHRRFNLQTSKDGFVAKHINKLNIIVSQLSYMELNLKIKLKY